MDIAIVFSRALKGIYSPQVTVEVHLSRDLPSLSIVGLPETAVKESKDRMRSAILTNHFDFQFSRITVLRKINGNKHLIEAISYSRFEKTEAML
jgi:magnesium chelatase family protein